MGSLTKKVDINIWDRDFSLKVEYDCYKGETVTDEQITALNNIISNSSLIDKTKDKVVKYCKNDVANDDKNNKKDNIFSYIKPDYIFVKHESKPRVAIMCKYKYDPEHGIAVVFNSNKKIEIGIQDIIL